MIIPGPQDNVADEVRDGIPGKLFCLLLNIILNLARLCRQELHKLIRSPECAFQLIGKNRRSLYLPLFSAGNDCLNCFRALDGPVIGHLPICRLRIVHGLSFRGIRKQRRNLPHSVAVGDI